MSARSIYVAVACAAAAAAAIAACAGDNSGSANDCRERTQPVMEAVQELNSRLDIGMNQDDYSSKVGDVKVAFDRVSSEEVSAECRKAISELGRAVEAYAEASAEWNDCITSSYCSEPDLQPHWDRAASRVERASALMRDS